MPPPEHLQTAVSDQTQPFDPDLINVRFCRKQSIALDEADDQHRTSIFGVHYPPRQILKNTGRLGPVGSQMIWITSSSAAVQPEPYAFSPVPSTRQEAYNSGEAQREMRCHAHGAHLLQPNGG